MLRRTMVLILIIVIFNLISVFPEEKVESYCKVKNAVITYEYYGFDKGTIKLMIKDYGSFVRREDNRIKTSNGEEKAYKFFYLLTPEYIYQANLHDSNIAAKMKRPAELGQLRLLLHEAKIKKYGWCL